MRNSTFLAVAAFVASTTITAFVIDTAPTTTTIIGGGGRSSRKNSLPPFRVASLSRSNKLVPVMAAMPSPQEEEDGGGGELFGGGASSNRNSNDDDGDESIRFRSYEEAMAHNRKRTDVRIFLTQRAIQSFISLLISTRDPHTVRWMEVSAG